MKNLLFTVCVFLLISNAIAENIAIELTVPRLEVAPYHRPYIAVWLETPERKGVHTIAIWYEKDDWLKDLRQWWRKLGRNNTQSYQAITGATRKPGKYTINWDGKNTNGTPIAAGNYLLCLEASREAGGRDFFRQKIQLNHKKEQHYNIQGDIEFGAINISIKP